jgi:HPt (histidine-containing phosphotransfer) domain-containing protein
MDCLALRIEALLRKLDEADPFVQADALAELAHELAGSAGALGFPRLSAVAARFETTMLASRSAARKMIHEIADEAKATLTELRCRRLLG